MVQGLTAFLAAIASKVLLALISAAVGWFSKMLHTWWKDREDTAANEARTAAAQKALEDAKTQQELDDAAKRIADGFGK